MDPCELFGGNCGICMIAAPERYCCRKECGKHEYCKGCSYEEKRNETK